MIHFKNVEKLCLVICFYRNLLYFTFCDVCGAYMFLKPRFRDIENQKCLESVNVMQRCL